MPSITVPARLVFDKSFYNIDIKQKYQLFKKLMYINDRTSGYKREANVMSKRSFEKILQENSGMRRELLRMPFIDLEVESLEQIEDEIERTIKYAIHVAKKTPFKSIIITAEENKQKYESNSHYQGVKEISVKAGLEAENIINNYFQSCTDKIY